MKQAIAGSAKAFVAGATPLAVAFVADVMLELSRGAQVGITAAAGAALVWLTKNAAAD